MKARVGTRKKSSEQSDSREKRPKRSRKPVHLTLDEQVWTLAKERFPNVSRTVEQLLRLALNLEPSLQMVVIPNWERRGSLAREGGGLEIHWALSRRGSNPRPGANAEERAKIIRRSFLFHQARYLLTLIC